MFSFSALIPSLDRLVEGLMRRQVTDPRRPDYGGIVSEREGLADGVGLGGLSYLAYAYLLEESSFHENEDLLDRIRLGGQFARRARRASGRFDLAATNFDSAPDTAFLVQALAPAVKAARMHTRGCDGIGSQVIADELGEIIEVAAPGIASGGFHTPNHRWVIVSALAQARELYPELDVEEAIFAYLGEGIDLNVDGEYCRRLQPLPQIGCRKPGA